MYKGPRAQLAPPLPQLLGNELPLSERMCSGIPRTNIKSANVSPNPEAQDRANRDDAAADRGKHRERNYPTSLQGSQPSAEPMSDGFRRSFSTFTRNDAVTRIRGKYDGRPVDTPYKGPMNLTRTAPFPRLALSVSFWDPQISVLVFAPQLPRCRLLRLIRGSSLEP
jgi:hypothetical protein